MLCQDSFSQSDERLRQQELREEMPAGLSLFGKSSPHVCWPSGWPGAGVPGTPRVPCQGALLCLEGLSVHRLEMCTERVLESCLVKAGQQDQSQKGQHLSDPGDLGSGNRGVASSRHSCWMKLTLHSSGKKASDLSSLSQMILDHLILETQGTFMSVC